jgi:hypothetical protein
MSRHRRDPRVRPEHSGYYHLIWPEGRRDYTARHRTPPKRRLRGGAVLASTIAAVVAGSARVLGK